MLIAVVSVVHVLVAHYAVGGGLFLAVETTLRLSHRQPRLPGLPEAARQVLRPADGRLRGHHRRGHLVDDRPGLAAGHAGADPHLRLRLGHRVRLLRRRDRLRLRLLLLLGPAAGRRSHTIIVWIYGLSAWASLVIIAAITAFMLDPGNWPADHNFWSAILNRQSLPQIISRTGGALLLSSLYVYLHAAHHDQGRQAARADRVAVHPAGPARAR